MAIIGVSFQSGGKLFYYDANDIPLQCNDYVVIDTDHGLDVVKVVVTEAKIEEVELSESPMMEVIRQAQPDDFRNAKRNREEEAVAKCKELARELGLKMKPLAAHCDIDANRLTIFFRAQERVDFRALVRKLSRNLKAHVELRQIGPRDEAKVLGSIGKCGYPLCCQNFITNFTSVSIKMAKEQDLPLNPMKISGICGRLLCCLAYEGEQYATMKSKMPQHGQQVTTPFGKATVIGTNLLKETVIVRLDSQATREIPLNQLT